MNEEQRDDLLIRLDERTKTTLDRLIRNEVRLAEFVTQTQFRPIQLIAYGLVGLFCSAMVGALLSLVLSVPAGVR